MKLTSPLPLRLSLLLAALLGLSQCKKSDTDPFSQLPQATQTGAGTIGFLLNSQPFLPSGNNGTPNFLTTYDPTYHGGNLDIRTYRYLGNTDKSQYLAFGGDSINQIGTYTFASSTFPATSSHTVYFFDNSKSSPCDAYDFRPGTKATGQLIITRLDKQKGIISGTFSFMLTHLGCDTIKVTQGRFDSSL